ncbi:lipid asymmetry maintenance protein MlaB [Salinisphaera hydrothermalis]|uniref:Sulfate transporter/antisigma-factor antagonist STAS n=1 Tax=Salinisphaera hydrothermalis (strain C41B8) TaxID=1304275 RepID=A0A084IL37_SALHC|nr:STAS domain-containing protein [Salinisphaera hydrothermalis]KEZ77421.1 sulfate transporter/antisigma-factor antagonist STAS [Salinisphaera hydrothermalis C41B8]
MSETRESDVHTVQVEGQLDAESVPTRLRNSAGWFEQGRDTVIDLSGVTRADSAGVALLLEWIRDADQAGSPLVFANAPTQMRAIIDFCALDDVIPLR